MKLCYFCTSLKMKKNGFILILLCSVAIVQAQVIVERDIKIAPIGIFDPMDESNTLPWVAQVGELEAPLPGGINEALRKKLDAQRMSKLKGLQNRSNNLTSQPTDPKQITTLLERGVEGSSGSGTPNDNSVAVGNDGKIINVLNTAIRVYNDTGRVIKFWSLENFVSQNRNKNGIPTLTRVYDPRIMFDPIANRWIVLYMHGTTDKTSFIVVGFSSSEDPLQPWNVYRITGKPINDIVWSDYPIVSQTKEDLFFTVNLLKNGSSWEEGFTEAIIWQVNKKRGYDGDTLRNNLFRNIKYQGVPIWSICPVQNGPMPEGIDNYFISVRPYSASNDTVFLHRITNTQSSGLAQYELKVLKADKKYGFPPSALQKDTSYKLRTNDCRALTGIRLGNSIQYLQNCINFKTMQAHVMHSNIFDIHIPQTYVRSHLITSDSFDMGYPAIASAATVDSDPSALITFGISGPYDYPSVAAQYYNRYREYSAIQKIKTGTSLINWSGLPKNEQRWGDYEGIQMKYNEPGVFYLVGSYGKNLDMMAYIARVKLKDKNWDNGPVDVKVFPVPTIKTLQVEYYSHAEDIYTVELTDILGRKAGQPYSVHLKEGINLFELNLESIALGKYFFVIKNKAGETVGKQQIFKTK